MSDLSVRPADGAITPAIHLEFIRSVVDAHEPEAAGADAIEAFHRAIFLQQHGREMERCRQDRRCREERLAGLEARWQHTRSRLAGVDPFLSVMEEGVADDLPNAPWNVWNRAMFVMAALAVVALLLFGVFNVSFNLLESGIVTFSEHPIRAYFWAALLPVGALAVKVGWDFLGSRRKRAAYLWCCLFVGMVSVLVWVGTYASIYPTLSRTTAEQIGNLSIFDDPTATTQAGAASAAGPGAGLVLPGGAKVVDMMLVASQATAEIFLSAVLGIYLTQLYGRHRPVKLVSNPVFARFDLDRRELELEMARERQSFADARGEEVRLENQLAIFVSYARSLFQREIALRRDQGHRKRRLIEEMASELRTRLDSLEREETAPGIDEAAAPQGNGHVRQIVPQTEVRP